MQAPDGLMLDYDAGMALATALLGLLLSAAWPVGHDGSRGGIIGILSGFWGAMDGLSSRTEHVPLAQQNILNDSNEILD